MSWLQVVSSCKFNNNHITPVSKSLPVDSFSNQACMFFHSFFYEFQMEINVALATPLKTKRQCSGHWQRTVVNLIISIWWLWNQREWEFINKEIQKWNSGNEIEWHIGLYRNLTTKKWTWINGKNVTINKWQKDKPQDSDFYTVMAKESSDGVKG